MKFISYCTSTNIAKINSMFVLCTINKNTDEIHKYILIILYKYTILILK